jgi:hypothetical protein
VKTRARQALLRATPRGSAEQIRKKLRLVRAERTQGADGRQLCLRCSRRADSLDEFLFQARHLKALTALIASARSSRGPSKSSPCRRCKQPGERSGVKAWSRSDERLKDRFARLRILKQGSQRFADAGLRRELREPQHFLRCWWAV